VMTVKIVCGNARLEITGGDPEFLDWGVFTVLLRIYGHMVHRPD